MEESNLYWTVVAGIATAVWVVVTYLRDRAAQLVAKNGSVMNGLREIEKINIEKPGIQQYISRHATRDEAYFREPERLEDACFIRAKTLVYTQLNFYDEILSAAAQSSRRGFLFVRPDGVVELSDWKTYILMKLRHPLYRSILNNEAHIFGESLRAFWSENRHSIEQNRPDPFIW